MDMSIISTTTTAGAGSGLEDSSSVSDVSGPGEAGYKFTGSCVTGPAGSLPQFSRRGLRCGALRDCVRFQGGPFGPDMFGIGPARSVLDILVQELQPTMD
jgi:hypothetical protein